MKKLNLYIIEKFKINSKTTKKSNQHYTDSPKNTNELRVILKERLSKDENADLNDIDVSQIENLGICFSGGLFEGLDPHDIKIDRWDVSHATSLAQMFYDCHNLTCDISDWNVSNVTNMYGMFNGCEKFNCDVSDWDVSNVTNMKMMFTNCQKFNCDLSRWDVSKVTNMAYMFNNCNSLKNKPDWYKE